MQTTLLAISILAATTMSGCGNGAAPTPPTARGKASGEGKGLQGLNASGDTGADSHDPNFDKKLDKAIGDGPADGPLYEATYDIKVAVDVFGGLTMCEGQINMIVNGDFSFTTPNSRLSCMGGLCDVDMNALMANFQKSTGGGAGKVLQSLEGDEKFVRIKEIDGAVFDPPRPIVLLSPLNMKDPSDARGLVKNYHGSLTNSATGEKASGTIRFEVTEANDDRVAWNMQSTGWESAPRRVYYGLVKKVDVVWDLKPIGVPHIGVVANVGDIMRGQGGQKSDPTEMVKMCSGTSGEVLQALASFAAPDPNAPPGIMDALGQLIADQIDSQVSIDLRDQKILGEHPR